VCGTTISSLPFEDNSSFYYVFLRGHTCDPIESALCEASIQTEWFAMNGWNSNSSLGFAKRFRPSSLRDERWNNDDRIGHWWFLSSRNSTSAICLTVPRSPFNRGGGFLVSDSKQTKSSFHFFVNGL
jgi:hypothetical protein